MATKTEPQKSATEVMAEIMLAERTELLQERQEKKAKLVEKNLARIASDAEKAKNELRRCAYCDHLQGNHKIGESPFREISHLSLHTFGGPSTKNNSRIRCNKCGFKWYPGDKADQIKRDGIVIDNPTGWSYADAYKVVMKNKVIGNKPSTGFVDVVVAVPDPLKE